MKRQLQGIGLILFGILLGNFLPYYDMYITYGSNFVYFLYMLLAPGLGIAGLVLLFGKGGEE